MLKQVQHDELAAAVQRSSLNPLAPPGLLEPPCPLWHRKFMIPVNWAPEIKPDQTGQWSLTLFTGDMFDYSIPFRDHLDRIVARLGPEAALRLPPWEEYEDFVEGILVWQGRDIQVYFEHSLAYLDLSSHDRTTVEDLLARIRPELTWDPAAA
jgi:hypothetical protein